MTYVAHTETDDTTGLTLSIIADEFAEDSNPLQDDDAVRLVILHRNRINPGEAYGLRTAEDAEAFAAENASPDSPWAVFPLFAYEHGNICYRPSEGGNPFNCPWDSGRVGIIALRRADFGQADPLEAARNVCRVYTDWCNGNVWGFAVTDAEGDTVSSVWGGYIGDYDGDALTFGRSELAHHRDLRLAALAAEAEADRPDLYGTV